MKLLRVIVVFLMLAPAVALAADGPPGNNRARARYEAGVRAYNLARFDQAIESFSAAYELDPAPILLFNIAQAHYKKEDHPRALFFYRRYMEADPTAANRAKVASRISELEAEAAREQSEKLVVAPPAPTFVRATPEPPPLYRRPWVWAVAGAVALGVAAVAVAASSSGDARFNCGSCELGSVVVGGR